MEKFVLGNSGYDPTIRTENDRIPARFGHLNVIVDYINNDLSSSRIIKNVFQPAELQTIGSAPLALLPKNNNFFASQIWMNLTVGSVLYDFAVGAEFEIRGNNNIAVCFSNAYPLQAIQLDEYNTAYLNESDGFKVGRFNLGNQELNLTTADGSDATQGDGVLTVWVYGFDLT